MGKIKEAVSGGGGGWSGFGRLDSSTNSSHDYKNKYVQTYKKLVKIRYEKK